LGWNAYKTEIPSELQKEVATALLFDSPVDTDHQSYDIGKQLADQLREYKDRNSDQVPSINISGTNGPVMVQDVEPLEEHPTRAEDAPVIEEGHPSPEARTDFRSRIQYSIKYMDRRLDHAIGYESDKEDNGA
jgi:hypothetical protein